MVLESTQTIAKSGLIVACIPAYNEEKTIGSIIIKLRKFVDKVIVCDDGSQDSTSEIVSYLGADLIYNDENKGKGYSVKRLLEHASSMNAKIVVLLDADGQHDPSDVPRIIEPIINNEADIVIGSRFVKGSHSDIPFYRKIGLNVVNALNRNGTGIKDTQNGFRAYSRAALVAMSQIKCNGYGVESEQLFIAAEHGLRIKEVPTNVQYNGLKTSKKNPVNHGMELVETGLKLIVERRPLLFLGIPGAVMLLGGAVAASFLLYYFNAEGYFSIPFAIIAMGAFVVGIFFIMTALILYGLRAMQQPNK